MAEITAQQAVHHHHDEEKAAYNENLKFAVWLYLGSEVVIFSILIAGYAIFRVNEPASVSIVKDGLGILLVSINTFILLASSFAMVMGLRAIEQGNRSSFYRWIGLTALMGTLFLGGQYIEYSELAHLGITIDKQEFSVETPVYESVVEVEADVRRPNGNLLVGLNLHTNTVYPEGAELPESDGHGATIGVVEAYHVDFGEDTLIADIDLSQWSITDDAGDAIAYSDVMLPTSDGDVALAEVLAGTPIELSPDAYSDFNDYFKTVVGDTSNFGMRFYAPTFFHGAHVFIGVLWALFVLFRGSRGRYDGSGNAIGVELFGLYWHFVDVVWIVLFTLIYLV